uniref:HicB superfamily n=1 Tax=Clostridium botulinum TaxID=1491 RepID=A0A0A0UY05_CLOBO|nr:HicB superfamily [Clostridium botulinum]AIW54721.1 HicB superfamily [Clostridium botulinum]AIW54783.1 HicB superfamily toxin-antitoxin system antitoxin component [Clostridium botulinum]AIW54850.1 HicB superfamily toxin-antitoxin system antitoxin component [Clostridium botulinum]
MFECYNKKLNGDDFLNKTITIRLSPELHKKLKIFVINENTNIQEFVVKLIENKINNKN